MSYLPAEKERLSVYGGAVFAISERVSQGIDLSELKVFPPYCPKCKQECLVDVKELFYFMLDYYRGGREQSAHRILLSKSLEQPV